MGLHNLIHSHFGIGKTFGLASILAITLSGCNLSTGALGTGSDSAVKGESPSGIAGPSDLVITETQSPTIGVSSVNTSRCQLSLQLMMKWTDTSNGLYVTRIYRSTDNVNFSEIGRVAKGLTAFTDVGVGYEMTYSYQLKYDLGDGTLSAANNTTAFNTGVCSTAINPPPPPPPPPLQIVPQAPTGLTAKVISLKEIDLSWSAAASGFPVVTSFELHRYPKGDGSHAQYPDRIIATVAGSTLSFKDLATDVPKATSDATDDVVLNGQSFRPSWEYSYYLVAKSTGGASPSSSTVIVAAPTSVVVAPPPPPSPPPPPPPPAPVPPVSSTSFGSGSGSPKTCTNYNVDSTNLQKTFDNATNGSTLCFAPGTYHVNSKVSLRGNHLYIGNGAIIVGPGNDMFFEADNIGGVEMTGFVFTNGLIHLTANASVNFHDNTFRDSPNTPAVKSTGSTETHIDHNSFFNIGGEGIMANPCGSNGSFDNNRFDNVMEPIHAIGPGNNLSISNNVITHTTRHAIEIQGSIRDSKFDNNWISDWLGNIDSKGNDSHMAISTPTCEGGNNEVAYNVMIQNGPYENNNVGAKGAVELCGSSYFAHHNYFWNWNWGYFGVSFNGAFTSHDNVFVGVAIPFADGSHRGTNDQIYSKDDPNAPKWPTPPAGVVLGP